MIQQPQQIYIQQQVSTNRDLNFSDNVLAQYGIRIPDNVSFEHAWEDKYQFFCCGSETIRSTFNVPGVGVLEYRKYIPCCSIECCKCCSCCTECCTCCQNCCDFHHYYRIPIYELVANNLTIACYEGNFANAYLGDQLFAEMTWPSQNIQDLIMGRYQSAYPQIVVQSGQSTFLLKPQLYECPQIQNNILCAPCAPLGYFATQRNIYVHRSKEIKAPVTIINKREYESQVRFHLLPCMFDNPNYPRFDITFTQSITQQERLLIILGLIQMSFYDQWSTILAESNQQISYHNLYNISKKAGKFVQDYQNHSHNNSQSSQSTV